MESDIFNVRITWKDGLGTTYTNASKIWLDNATRRYVIHRKDRVEEWLNFDFSDVEDDFWFGETFTNTRYNAFRDDKNEEDDG